MNTVAIVQARMISSRLPGKVLLDAGGKPLLLHTVERLKRAGMLSQVVVATTTDPTDDAVIDFCKQHKFECFRGSLHDVLDRFYQAARLYEADIVVRITADCPLIDPAVVDLTIRGFAGEDLDVPITMSRSEHSALDGRFPYDFAANRLPPPWKRSYPIGLDTEVCSFLALEKAWQEADRKYQREHVMPYLYDDIGVDNEQVSRFRILQIHHDPDYGHLRWTVDTSEDLEVVRRILAYFQPGYDFSWLEIVNLLEHHPELIQLNAAVKHKSAFDVDHRNKTDDYRE